MTVPVTKTNYMDVKRSLKKSLDIDEKSEP